MPYQTNEMKVFAGSASLPLAEKITQH
ncbi:MAG: Ribose-phosphate pyrophosphokinase, partial [Mesotoga infera]